MSLTPQKLQFAASLNTQVQKHIEQGKDDIAIFADMAASMPDFKRLMDTSKRSELDELCRRFPYFYKCAQILETIAARIQPGDIRVPK
jgi:ApbE superfamily uncharacterized protein (UPF0280 family)